jgi:glycosyltransferase involved in cell wall biosynthesis
MNKIPFPYLKFDTKYLVQLEVRGSNTCELKYIAENIGFNNVVIFCIFRFYRELKDCKLLEYFKSIGFTNFIVCPNSKEQKRYYSDLGFNTFKINWHFNVRNDTYYINNSEKIYDIVCDSTFPHVIPWGGGEYQDGYWKWHYKKHYLLRGCNHITKALISRQKNEKYLQNIGITYNYVNEVLLSELEVNEIYNQSKVGVILSTKEGSCMASAQYLLCGLPIVSTYCQGGREDYYNEDNCILVEPNEESVKEGIEKCLKTNFDREKIRTNFLKQRENEDTPEWINMLSFAFKLLEVDVDAETFFYNNIYKKGYGGIRTKCSIFPKCGIFHNTINR